MGNGSSKPPVAAHVAAAMARAGQCKVASAAASPLAPHVAAAMARAGQCKLASAAASPLAPHVAAAMSRAGQCKVASVAAIPLRQPAPVAPARAGAAIQPMKRKAPVFDDPRNPTSFAIAEHLGRPVKKRKIDIQEFELGGESDDEEVVETARNFFTAHTDLSSSFGHDNVLTAPTGYGRKQRLNLSNNEAQWKRVDTEYIGEVGAFQVMSDKGYKLGFSTGVMGGRGIDQVWYKGSLTNDRITEIVVVEAKGPGAKLSKAQRGSTSARLSSTWVENNAEVMSRSLDTRKSALGLAITEKLGGRRKKMKLRGLIVSHDSDGNRKVGKMHDL